MLQKNTDHDYYCSDSNYYSNGASMRFSSVSCFLDEYEDADIDMNLCFRFDIERNDETGLRAKFYLIHQRKGIFNPIFCNSYDPKVESDRLEKYLKKHWEKLKRNWVEISSE